MTRRRAVAVVGIGDDGCVGLTSRAINRIASAEVLVGGARQLEFFPEFSGERIVLKSDSAPDAQPDQAPATALAPRKAAPPPSGLVGALERVAELAEEHNVCVLASGDPLFFGIGSLIVKKLGAAHVEFLPQPSCMQLAFARAGLKWDDASFISLHGRALRGLVTRLRRSSKAALLTDAENSPARIATHLLEYGQTAWGAYVCENLGGPGERVRSFDLATLAQASDIAPLNVLLLVRDAVAAAPLLPFLHEDEFAKRVPKKGLITKREVRLLSLAALELRIDSVVWDIGAGSGSVAIEAALLATEGCVYAIEIDPEGVALCRENVRSHGADNVVVVAGRAPEVLAELEAPDAVFVGGSKGSMDAIIDAALTRLTPGGRLVINAVTLENAAEAYQALRRRELTPQVTLVQLSRAEPLAHYLRYEALNPIQVFSVTKPLASLATQRAESAEVSP